MTGSGGGTLAVLGLGSNRARGACPPRAVLEGAARDLERTLADMRIAPFYETAPLHVADQPDFLKTAVCGIYAGSPRALLAETQAVEAAWGRDRARERRFGERTLDIDILLFGDLVWDDGVLALPHPRLHERAFALVPLLDLLPAARDPRSGALYADCLRRLGGQSVKKCCQK
jgi:2-amino-4-hydroxy-6-hydroxymethyldihydropteridine diphosphokinase